MRPRFPMVEKASTRFVFCSVVATSEAKRKVRSPVQVTKVPTAVPPRTGESFKRRKTPAFTMVLEWRRAEVGVGAYMAPRSHEEKGICALLVSPASDRSASAGSAAATG